MATSRSTVVRRPHGIPGTDKNKVIREQRKVVSLNGPVQPRKSLTIEQQQPALAQASRLSSATTPVAAEDEEVTRPVAAPSRTASKPEPTSTVITLVSRKETPIAHRDEHEEPESDEQDEHNDPDTDSLHGEDEDDYDEEEPTQVYEPQTARTRTIPTTERNSYQDEEAYTQRRTNSYAVPRQTTSMQRQQPPTPATRTRETGGRYPNAAPSKVVPAGQLDQSRSNYRPSNDPNKTRVLPRQQHHGHPLLFVGLGMAVLIIGWFATTSGASWFTTHFIDPSTYGPMHGSVAFGIFGGGDSETHPSQLIAMNSNGQVEILKLTAGDPKKAQIIVGPNLITLGFANPKNAEVALNVQGNTLTVTIYGDSFPLPLHRFNQTLTFRSDGKGNLKPVSALPAQ